MQRELQQRLDAEKPRNHLDMRHRLDKDGNRYGKLIPYVVSEQRMDDLLSSLCDAVDTAVQLMEVLPVNNTGTEPERKLPREWVQISGVTQNISNGMSKVSEPNHTAAKRELGLFCNGLLEVHEDDLIAAIREGTQTGANSLLCLKACAGEKQKAAKDEL